jgi:hypothetical protein
MKIKYYASLLVKGSAVALAAICISRFCHSRTDGFALYKIRSSLPYCAEWATDDPSPQEQALLDEVFNQPFYYLAKGAQSYVFRSQDNQYVIKFFRLYHLQPPSWLNLLSLPYPLEQYKVLKKIRKNEELAKDFLSYKIAHQEMKEETGLIYLHLNKTKALNKQLKIIDKIGVAHHVDLDQMEFLVQKKASLVYPAIAELAKSQGEESAKEAIHSLIALLKMRCEKGICDKDPDLNTNFGFLGTKAIQIDFGRFRKEESIKDPQLYRDELIRITDHFHQWLDREHPNLSAHLEEEIDKAFS